MYTYISISSLHPASLILHIMMFKFLCLLYYPLFTIMLFPHSNIIQAFNWMILLYINAYQWVDLLSLKSLLSLASCGRWSSSILCPIVSITSLLPFLFISSFHLFAWLTIIRYQDAFHLSSPLAHLQVPLLLSSDAYFCLSWRTPWSSAVYHNSKTQIRPLPSPII